MEFNINELLISPELVRSIVRYFLLWFWCCVAIAFIWSLFNIDYLDKQLEKPIWELFKKEGSE